MRRFLPVLIILSIILVVAGCGSSGTKSIPSSEEDTPVITDTETATAKEGALPIMVVGDRWVQKGIAEGIEYISVLEVTGEDVTDGKECYVMKMTFDPPYQGIVSSCVVKMEKETLRDIREQMSVIYSGVTLIIANTYSYQITGDPLYPLEVGKESKIVENIIMTTVAMGETSTETETNIYIRKVESIEEITVPAGTFKTFKIVEYSEDGRPLYTMWQSYDTKLCSVKKIDNETGEITELISYSVNAVPSMTY